MDARLDRSVTIRSRKLKNSYIISELPARDMEIQLTSMMIRISLYLMDMRLKASNRSLKAFTLSPLWLAIFILDDLVGNPEKL